MAGLYARLEGVAQTRLADTEAARQRYLGLTWAGDDSDTPGVEEVDRDELLRRARDGAIVLDVRPTDEYACGHIPGAVSVDVRSGPVFPHVVDTYRTRLHAEPSQPGRVRGTLACKCAPALVADFLKAVGRPWSWVKRWWLRR